MFKSYYLLELCFISLSFEINKDNTNDNIHNKKINYPSNI